MAMQHTGKKRFHQWRATVGADEHRHQHGTDKPANRAGAGLLRTDDGCQPRPPDAPADEIGGNITAGYNRRNRQQRQMTAVKPEDVAGREDTQQQTGR